jgi:RNA polymerase sigma-70 factor (ECF subfamily)
VGRWVKAMAHRDRSQPSDAELATQAAAGSADAFHDLVRRFERPVLSLIARMVRDPSVAEDLAQETFVKAFRYLDRYDPQRKLASWLFKIAHNTSLDYLRRHRPETVALEVGGDEDEEGLEVLAASAAESPQRRLESVEVLAGLEEALATLTPRYREILLLRFREGLAYQEIADVIGVPMGTMKIQLFRARKQLGRALVELGFEIPGLEAKQDG